jgi:hypothetical protein
MRNRVPLILAFITLVAWAPLQGSEPSSETLVTTALGPAPLFALTAPPALAPQAPAFEGFVIPETSNFQVPRPLPSPRMSSNAGKALFDANLVLMVGLNVADYFSTKEALKYPGLEETNPLMKPFVKSPTAFAAIKIGTTALSYWSMKSLFKKNRTMAWIMTTASNALLSYVVVNNMRLVQRARAL